MNRLTRLAPILPATLSPLGVVLPYLGVAFAACSGTDFSTANPSAGASGGTAGNAGNSNAAQGGTGGETGATGGTSNREGVGGNGGDIATSAGGTSSGAAGESNSGGEGGSGGSGTDGTVCDRSKAPNEDACVIDEDYGVFVSPNGDDDIGNGSRTKPFATLAMAISDAIARGKRVYACADAGRYQESLDLDATSSGLEMFGGFSCADWSYSTSAQSRLSSKVPLALHAEKLKGLRIEDFRIDAADATDPGASSIGVFVVSSSDVVFRRVRISAGKGKAGADGTRNDFTFPAKADLDGYSATGPVGGMAKICGCPGDTETSGGGGGDPETDGQPGGTGTPDYDGPGGEGGTTLNADCNTGRAGSNGANAPATSSATGALDLGSLASTGWIPGSGSDGLNGLPGQGGGGGASRGTPGSGGGCGSCGGAGGKGGQGGGASVAFVAIKSEVSLDSAELIPADGGNGGNGIAGQPAQPESGLPGSLVAPSSGCMGGAGGLGAAGGASGGGAGGISVGILWSGSAAPTRTDVTISTGNPGERGIGGEPGTNDGIAGIAGDVLKAP